MSKCFSDKEETPHKMKSNVVYVYKRLKDKSIRYIGFTSRPLIERIKEHLKIKTAVSDHIIDYNTYKNIKLTVKNLKEYKNKFEMSFNEANLIKPYNQI